MWSQRPAGLGGLSTPEERLLATLALVLAGTLTARYLLPTGVRLCARFAETRVPQGRIRGVGEALSRYLPSNLATTTLHLLQAGTLGVAAVGVLLAWDQADLARQALGQAGIGPRRLGRIALTLGLFGVAYVCINVFRGLVAQYSDGVDRVTDHQEEIIVRVGNVGITTLALTSVLTLWGLDLSGLLVGAGFLGIVVGMAARQTLGSLIAGFVLMFSQPFTIGDWVQVGDDEGIVTDITIMDTRMKNFDGESIIIPNDRVSNQAITNRSAQGHLRIRVDVGIDYATDPDEAEQVALEAIREETHVADAPSPQVVPKTFGDSAVVLELRFWIDRPTPARKWQATSEVVTGVKRAFEAEGIKIPFPQRELSDRPATSGIQVHGEEAGEVGPSAED